MRGRTAETWADVAMLVLACGIALPYILGASELSIARIAWAGLFLGFGLGTLAVMVSESPLRLIGYLVCVSTACAMVLTAEFGLVSILLVATVAMGVYIVPLWCVFAVIALNSAAVAGAGSYQELPFGLLCATVGFYLIIQLAVLFSTVALLRERRLRAELADAHAELRANSEILTQVAATAERMRISRELHDVLGHRLTALALQLEVARQLASNPAKVPVDRAVSIARELLADVRETVGKLRMQAPELELALRNLGEAVPGIRVAIRVGAHVRANEQTNSVFVRAAQEVITNAVKHSGASTVSIDIDVGETGLVFLAVDDGGGAACPTMGNGLRGLHERFAELGGGVEIDGSAGFRVTAKVPHQ